ncbi:uncharacterized protein YueI [Virgibacillus halotolerans]|uniref:YueI family protein n=1 Tax=Virgibacillus halotolerans TaxID=1071053 RepID=UPI001961B365|nr:YueI family protein [Virgibacillus halotolerans]MBM7599697.1 uncharacterized protein YueI [Virgibacillus halotolerans]
MSDKSVEDYLTEGIYGVRRPKEAERIEYLGTLRERIVLALTIGQVMTDSGLSYLEQAMIQHQDTKLLINGHVANRFLKEEKALADKYNIPFTTITNNESDTNIGAVLTYDYAIDKEDIFMEEEPQKKEKIEKTDDHTETGTIFSKIKQWFQK